MPTVVQPALIPLTLLLLVGAAVVFSRRPLVALRYAFREMEAVVRSALRLPPAAAKVCAIRCPRCRRWVKPRRFDLQRMACRGCLIRFGARSVRGGDLCL
ncbi:hypothetical protein [Micromonospora inyonensis]|uniref:Uncharacterized protein n=1 Tax=Micromonospora inyonensis TaxID=47866 RepID=A0A1C6RI50_9ACTN|nr:hypothetical protein [Micromonospora inyonensis]SCL16876.1 hypothetical protein GA0074694_1803 [Micromonospora inyonensis]